MVFSIPGPPAPEKPIRQRSGSGSALGNWFTNGCPASLTKTNQVLIAEQGAVGTSYGGWLADEIHRRFFDLLDAPVRRVTGAEASPSISRVLERAAIAQKDEVIAELTEIAGY